MLGPTGMGLIGAFQSSFQLVQKVSSLGIGFSAVREVAQANASGDKEAVDEIISVLRKIVFVSGLVGGFLLVIFAAWFSEFTFGSSDYTLEIRFLSLVVFFNSIKGGQAALIQGLRKIKDLSKLTIWGSLFSTVFSIPLIFLWGSKGIVPFLIMVSCGQLVVSWYYARKIKIRPIKLGLLELVRKSRGMVKLGIAFMGGGLTTLAGAYLIRVLIIRVINIEGVGVYQAATAISVVYIGIVLDAMAKDFYPRLTGVVGDDNLVSKAINDQTEVGILLAGPGLLFTLAFTPFLINLFYSDGFSLAYDILRWMILGVFLQVISWPLGYLFVAKGKGKVFFLIQLVFNTLHLILLYLFLNIFGIVGTGIAFLGMYIIHVPVLFFLVRIESGFMWSRAVIKKMLISFTVFLISFFILVLCPKSLGTILVSAFALIFSGYTLFEIMKIYSISNFHVLYQLFRDRIASKFQK